MKTRLLFLCIPVFLHAQFSIGHRSLEFTDATRDDREVPVEVYYPAQNPGDDVAVADGAFPLVVFGHGFVMTWSAYENIWQMLVPQGFIVVFPRTETGILPSHGTFAQDLAFTITAMQGLNSDNSSDFFGRITDQAALMGHSMGGGAALLSAADHPEFSAVAVLAPAETNPSAIDASAQIAIPVLVIAGSNDCVTPPSANQLPMYEAISNEVCKTYISITGGGHCQMANSNFLCEFGEATCSPSPDISRQTQHQIIENFLVDWLRATLKADCDAASDFQTALQAGEGITSAQECELCPPLSAADASKLKPQILNPFNDFIAIKALDQQYRFTLFDLGGRKMKTKSFFGDVTIETADLSPGVYLYEMADAQSVFRGKLVK